MAYDKVTLMLPTKSYATSMNAESDTNDQGIIKAGSYYLIGTNGNYSAISEYPDGSNSIWVPNENVVDSNGNRPVDNMANPSNTNTTSGYQTTTKRQPRVVLNTYQFGYTSDYFDSYIINLLTMSKIEFQMPQEMSDTISAEFEQSQVRGRSLPINGYSSSGPRSISISIPFQADLCKENFDVVVNKVKALAYPSYEGFAKPPKCIIKLGNVIRDQFIVNSVGVNYQGPMRDHRYTVADVSLDLVWVPTNIPDVVDIENTTLEGVTTATAKDRNATTNAKGAEARQETNNDPNNNTPSTKTSGGGNQADNTKPGSNKQQQKKN